MNAKHAVSLMGVVLAATVTWLAGPAEVHACSCAAGPDIRPKHDDVAATNTKIWIGRAFEAGSHCDSPALHDEDGTVVETSVSTIEPGTIVLTPTALLAMGATYTVVCGTDGVQRTFTVSAEEDLEPPGVPAFTVGEYSRTTESEDGVPLSTCGSHEYISLDVSPTGAVTVVDVAGRANLEPNAPSGAVVEANLLGNERILIGDAACRPPNWSYDEDGDFNNVRLGAFDLAGNFSGWTTTQDVDLPALREAFEDSTGASGCACSTAGAPSRDLGAGVMVLLGLVASLRRRPRGSR